MATKRKEAQPAAIEPVQQETAATGSPPGPRLSPDDPQPVLLHDTANRLVGGIKLEKLVFAEDELQLVGWCLGSDELILLCDGRDLGAKVERVPRQDVLEAFSADSRFDPGFTLTVENPPCGSYKLRWNLETDGKMTPVDFLVAVDISESHRPPKAQMIGNPTENPDIRYFIDGFESRRAIAGWIKNLSIDNRVYTVELLEDSEVIATARTDLPHELGGLGRFRIQIPDRLLDGEVHEFVFVLAEHELELESRSFLLPLPEAAEEEDRYPFLEDSLWANTPAEIAKRKSRRNAKPPQSDTEKQIKTIHAALEKTPSGDAERRYELICEIGYLLKQDNQTESALTQFHSAIDLDLENPKAYGACADILLAAGREQECESFLRSALRQLPDEPELLARLDRLLAVRREKSCRLIAFYLPQFHPTPENDRWWGKGFTEWTNVAAATPLFPGHLQPRRPTALGYYDLRLPETANAQFELARKYGIDAFCYYYYWFDGKRVLDRPLQDLVDGRTGPFPFCICWANEDWTRSWDGQTGEVLLAQKHTAESDLRFIQDIAPLLRHADYVRHEGKPVLLVYRATKLGNPKKTVKAWREWCRKEGIGELHLCAVQSFGFDDPRPLGFDAAVEFPPHCVREKYPKTLFHRKLENVPFAVKRFSGNVFDYQVFADAFINRPREPYTLHPCCFLAWDNTARRGITADIFHNFTVDKYQSWLSSNLFKAGREEREGLVFVNAWNEWAEGTVLEPDTYFGYGLLEATRRAKAVAALAVCQTYWKHGNPRLPNDRLEPGERILVVGHDAHAHGAQINLLNMTRCLKRDLGMEVLVLLMEDGPLVAEYERVGTTVVLGHEDGWDATLANLLQHYSAQGARKAICNTVVTGEVAKVLRGFGYHVVSLVHELPSLIESGGLQAACFHVAGSADNIVFASDIVAREFRERYWPDSGKILIAPQGIAFNPNHPRRQEIRDEIREELDWPASIRIVVGCGYGDTRKGIDLFVQMADEVTRLAGEEAVGFIWIGAVDGILEPYLRADIKRLNLTRRFHVTGRTDNPARYYIAADLYALTSREDPFPSVVMEAFDAGLPVVAFAGGGGYVDIVNDQTGALVPYLDVPAMSAALAALLKDNRKRQRISDHVHQYCRATFGYPAYMRKLLALLDGVPAKAVAKGILGRQAWYEDTPRPTITAIVPNYNYGRYLELRLRTILDQTLPPTEIIVLDDASTDYSLEVIRAVAEKSSVPIKLVTNEANTGNPFVQWAKGLEQATGELVWIAEADDYCEPTLLETLAKELIEPNIVMAWTDSIIVDDLGASHGFEYKNYYAKEQGAFWHGHFKMAGKELIDRCLLAANVVPNASAVLFRRQAVDADLSLIQQYRFSGDWWFWISLAQKGDVAYRADALNYHRRHSQSVMGDVLREGEKLIPETVAFYQRVATRKPELMSPQARIRIFQQLERMYRLFPKLAAQAPRLKEHPAFKAAYQALFDLLDPLSAFETVSKPTAATLILSQDVVDDIATMARLIRALSEKHELQLAILGDGDATEALLKEVDLDATAIHLLPGKTKNAKGARREAKKAAPALPAMDQVTALAALLGKTRHAISHGLQAHAMTHRAWKPDQGDWTLVAGNDFNVLLGALPDEKITSLEELADAIERCTTACFITETPSHAFARMALATLRPVERLDLNNSSAPTIRKQGKRNSLLEVRVAATLTTEQLAEEIERIRRRRAAEKVDIRLQLLVIEDDMPRIRALAKGVNFVELVYIYEKPTSFLRKDARSK